MQEPLRIVCVEHPGEDPGNVARILTEIHLDFGWRRVASPDELIRMAAEFNPHVVLCTDDLVNTSSGALLGALRLLCSQTPVILVSSMGEAALEMEAPGLGAVTEARARSRRAGHGPPSSVQRWRPGRCEMNRTPVACARRSRPSWNRA